MALCTPRIIGPLSAWNRQILIEGAVPGATVVVCEDAPGGQTVVKAIAEGGRVRLDLLPGTTLKANAALLALQSMDAEDSLWTDGTLATRVLALPKDYAGTTPLAIQTQIFPCGQAVWVEGALPGAVVVLRQGSSTLGEGVADEGIARLELAQGISGSDQVSAVQHAPTGSPSLSGAPTPTLAPVLSFPVAEHEQLPQPSVSKPGPAGCDASFVIGDVIEGARVTIERVSEGFTESALFDLPALTYLLGTPLSPSGGKLEISQSVWMRCGFPASDPLVIEFPPAQTPPTPVPTAPCGGSRFLLVDNIKPGALVEITVGAITWKAQASTIGTSQTFELAPMSVGETVSVVQSACGLTSEPGTTTVVAATASTEPVVERPLYGCARVVRVSGLKVGALVCLFAKGDDGDNMITPRIRVHAESMAIKIPLFLVKDQWISAEQVACGGPALRSPAVQVEDTPSLKEVNIDPAFSTQRFVSVDAVPGAYVIVREAEVGREKVQEGEILGTGYVDATNRKIWLNRVLVEKESIVAEQHFCALRKNGNPIEVGPGEKVFDLSPDKVRLITSEPDAEVRWAQGRLLCRVDGYYELSGYFSNSAEESYVDLDANASLSGLVFGATIKLLMAADNNPDDPTNQQLIANGHTPERTVVQPGHFQGFKDPSQWQQVLTSSATFELMVAVQRLPHIEDIEEGAETSYPPPGSE